MQEWLQKSLRFPRQTKHPMSNFALEEKGEGRFAVSGEVSFQTAQALLRASESVFGQHASLDIDLSGVERADSAALALLLEWKSQAHQRSADIRFSEVPETLLAIARTSEVAELI